VFDLRSSSRKKMSLVVSKINLFNNFNDTFVGYVKDYLNKACITFHSIFYFLYLCFVLIYKYRCTFSHKDCCIGPKYLRIFHLHWFCINVLNSRCIYNSLDEMSVFSALFNTSYNLFLLSYSFYVLVLFILYQGFGLRFFLHKARFKIPIWSFQSLLDMSQCSFG